MVVTHRVKTLEPEPEIHKIIYILQYKTGINSNVADLNQIA